MRILLLLLLPILTACPSEPQVPLNDAGPIDVGFQDAGPMDGTVMDATPDSGVCGTDLNCAACAADGECCYFSINCSAGSICNVPTESLFDPTKPSDVCIRVVCGPNDPCEAGMICSLEGTCVEPTCQTDTDCTNATQCVGGVCTSIDPDDAASCEVIGESVYLRSGSSAVLDAVVRDANGAILPGVAVAWTSDTPSRASVSGNVATGGGEAGIADLTASVGGIACTGVLQAYNFLPLAGETRVVVVTGGPVRPIVGAFVYLRSGAVLMGASGSDGSVTFPVGTPEWVTVSAPGFATITVMAPGTSDILIALPQQDITVAGGARGKVDISSVAPSDIGFGLAGTSLAGDALELGRTPITGLDAIISIIDAPELGFDMEEQRLPGGFMMSVGNNDITADAARCLELSVGDRDLGCFISRGREGPGALWTLSGELRLAVLTRFANELSESLSGTQAPEFEASVAAMPVFRELHHGVESLIQVAEQPKVNTPTGSGDCSDPSLPSYSDNCEPEYASYTQVAVAADRRQSVLSVVAVPALPRIGLAGCAPAMTLMLAVDLGRRDLVPLGFGAAADVADLEAPDCTVAGVSEPFGPASASLSDGEIALTSAPRHGGLEDGSLVLVTVARDPNLDPSAPFERSVLIDRLDALAPRQAVAGPFSAPPVAAIDTQTASIALDGAGVFSRIELSGGRQRWLVYVPSGITTIGLPLDGAPAGLLSALSAAYVARVDAASMTIDQFFELGSARRADQSMQFVERYAVVECTRTGDSTCNIQ